MSLARKIFSNTAWQVFGKAVTAVLGIVSIKFVTNYLSRSTYGEYTTIYDYTALFAIIADFGLFTIAVREMAHENSKEMTEKIVGNILSIRTALAVSALGVGILIAVMVPAYSGSHIPYGVVIVSIATLITLVAGTMSSVLQFYLKMRWTAIGLSLGKVITVAYIVATIFYFYPNNPEAGFPHLQIAWIVGSLATILVTYIASSACIKIKPQFDFVFWKNVLVKALPYGLALVLGTIYFRMGTLVLSLYKMKEQIGYYGVPLRFLEILQIVPHYFMGSVLPVLTISLKSNTERASRIIRYCLNALAALALPILIGGYLLSWPITAAVSSPDFLSHRDAAGVLVFGSDFALKILLVAMCFTYMHVVLSYAMVAMGRQIELLWINAVAVVINVTLNFILAPKFGFVGASISAVSTELVMLVCLFIRTRKYLRGIWDIIFISKTALSACAMGVVLFYSADYFNGLLFSKSLFVLVPLGGVVFAAGMWATRAISPEMIRLLRKEDIAPVEELKEY
jgi:O-antigen/teichoic acid export membrane protein